MTEPPASDFLSSVALSAFSPLRREAPRPVAFRTDDFEAKFDSDVLVYDAFRRLDGKVLLLGPPLCNLAPLLRGDSLRSLPDNAVCAFRHRQLDRQMQIVAEAPAGCRALALDLGGHQVEIPIRPNMADRFAGRRVLLTKTRNNDPAWVRDWAAFNVRFHGADALLLYDNLSDPDITDAVRAALRQVAGLDVVEMVSWPFKFGPQGLDARRFWDSDFCELGALEHARWRFLGNARAVQTGDVDELVLSKTGRSVFAAAEADVFGVVRYRGRWIVGTDRMPPLDSAGARRHSDYDTVLRRRMGRRFGLLPHDANACPPKWTVVPRRCPEAAQWGVHRIRNWLPAARTTTEFCFRHFREITSNWKYNRLDRDAFDPALHEIDTELVAHFGVLAGEGREHEPV